MQTSATTSKMISTSGKVVIAGLILLAFVLPLIFSPFTMGMTKIKTTFFNFVLSLLLAVWGFSAIRNTQFKALKFPLRRDVLSYAIAFFFTLLIISLIISRYKYASFEEITRYASYFGLYFLIQKYIKTKRQADLMIGTIFIVTGLVCIVGIYQMPRMAGGSLYRIMSSFGNANFFAGYLAIVIPIIVVAFFTYHSWAKPIGALYGLAITCLIFTETRGAFIGLIVAFLVLGVLLFRFLPKIFFQYKYRFISLVLLTIIPLVFSAISGRGILQRAIQLAAAYQVKEEVLQTETKEVLQTGAEVEIAKDATPRQAIWRGTLGMFSAKPIFGWGVGTFQVIFPQFRPVHYRRSNVQLNTLHAHSEYMEVAAELGIIGLVAFLSVIVLFFLRSYRSLRTLTEEKSKLMVIGLSCAVIAGLAHNLVSVGLRWTEPAVTFWLAFGLTMVFAKWASLAEPIKQRDDNEAQNESPKKNHSQSRKQQKSRKQKSSSNGQKETKLVKENPLGFRGKLCKVMMYSLLSITLLSLLSLIASSFASEVYLHFGDLRLKSPDKAKAASLLEKACKYNPYNPPVYYRLGYAYLKLNRPKDALRMYNQLSELAPNYSQIHINLVANYLALKRTDEALDEAQKAAALSDDASTYTLLAKIYIKKRNYEEVERALLHATKVEPEFVEGWCVKGELYARTRQYEKSITNYCKALQLKPKDPMRSKILFAIAEGYERLNQLQNAQNYYQQLLDEIPKSKLVTKAKERLTKIRKQLQS